MITLGISRRRSARALAHSPRARCCPCRVWAKRNGGATCTSSDCRRIRTPHPRAAGLASAPRRRRTRRAGQSGARTTPGAAAPQSNLLPGSLAGLSCCITRAPVACSLPAAKNRTQYTLAPRKSTAVRPLSSTVTWPTPSVYIRGRSRIASTSSHDCYGWRGTSRRIVRRSSCTTRGSGANGSGCCDAGD